MPIKSVDLNLFRVTESMMRQRSVAASAHELNVTTSAVNHALARLRQTLHDPLFVLTSEGMTPTARALELAPTVSEGLGRLAEALDTGAFEPTTSARSFALGMSDYATTIILPAIVQRIARTGPNIDLRIFPLSRKDLIEQLDAGRLDMALGWFASVPPRMGRMPAVIEGEALVVRKGHPLTRQDVTLERLFDFPHVVVELLGAGDRPAHGFVDEQGVERRVWIERLLLERENPAGGLVGRVAVPCRTICLSQHSFRQAIWLRLCRAVWPSARRRDKTSSSCSSATIRCPSRSKRSSRSAPSVTRPFAGSSTRCAPQRLCRHRFERIALTDAVSVYQRGQEFTGRLSKLHRLRQEFLPYEYVA